MVEDGKQVHPHARVTWNELHQYEMNCIKTELVEERDVRLHHHPLFVFSTRTHRQISLNFTCSTRLPKSGHKFGWVTGLRFHTSHRTPFITLLPALAPPPHPHPPETPELDKLSLFLQITVFLKFGVAVWYNGRKKEKRERDEDSCWWESCHGDDLPCYVPNNDVWRLLALCGATWEGRYRDQGCVSRP